MGLGLLEKCEISYADDGNCEDHLLGCATVLLDGKVPIFWSNIQP